MLVTALLFARPREVAGTSRVELELEATASAADALEALSRMFPGLAEMKPSMRCAVDGEYVDWDTVLRDGSEVALIPPTAGG